MSAISDKHQSLGGSNGPLGAQVGREVKEPWGGLSQRYTNGQIFFHVDIGAHALTGGALDAFVSAGGVEEFGYPLEDTASIAGGQAVYLERGSVWTGAQGTFVSRLSAPLIGRPSMIEPSAAVFDVSVQNTTLDAPPDVLTDLWQGRLFLQAVGGGAQELALVLDESTGQFRLGPGSGPLQDRRLYNVIFRRGAGTKVLIAPHAFYAKQSWDNFGLIHATDVHVSRRLETFRRGLLDGGQPEGSAMYECANDRLRDMIRAANKLHQEGSLDAILMTGDLVDFELEEDDDRKGLGNYKLLRDLLLGKVASSDPSIASEELAVPVFTVLGNHDYRRSPYELFASAEIAGVGVWDINQYENHNLIEEDAFVLQGRKKISLSAGEALEMIRVDEKQKPYERIINDQRSFVVKLGRNRIVMLDTRYDAGLPKATLSDDTGILDAGALDGLSLTDIKQLTLGSPNLVGVVKSDLEVLKNALSETVEGGSVIVGVHGPPIDVVGGEYPWYFRETLRSRPEVADEVVGFLNRHTRVPPNNLDPGFVMNNNRDWLPNLGPQPAHFRLGNLTNKIDAGATRGETEEFMKLCAGQGSARAADLILCGHGHKHTEYRVKRQNGQFALFMDFYSENPRQFYNTRVRDGRSIHIEVAPGGDMKPLKKLWDPSFAEYWKMVTPPNATPLSATTTTQQAAEWWTGHRPIVMQTSSLGLLENRQRVVFDNDSEPEKPGPTFQGYRILTIRDNTITRIQHVGQAQARKLRGWGRRTVSRLADTHGTAGAVSEVKLLRLNDTQLVSLVRADNGELLLITWSVLLGAKETGAFTRTGEIRAGKASGLGIVKAGSFIVTSCRNDSGNLLLISWRVDARGKVTRRKDSGNAAKEAQMISLVALSDNLLVSACRDGSGDLLLITWRLEADGSFRRLSDSGNAAGEIGALAMVNLPNGRVVTAVRAGNGRLLLIAWEVSPTGAIRRLSDSGEKAGEIGPLGGISACVDHLGRIAVSVCAGDNRLKIILWELGANGQLIRRSDSAGQAGKIAHPAPGLPSGLKLSEHTLTTASSAGNRSILVSAVTTEAGTLKLLTWDVTNEGAIRRLSQAAGEGEAGIASRLSLIAGPVSTGIPAAGIGVSFPIVTALRAANGNLLLISWRAKNVVQMPSFPSTSQGSVKVSSGPSK
jgi:hypothetical protein